MREDNYLYERACFAETHTWISETKYFQRPNGWKTGEPSRHGRPRPPARVQRGDDRAASPSYGGRHADGHAPGRGHRNACANGAYSQGRARGERKHVSSAYLPSFCRWGAAAQGRGRGRGRGRAPTTARSVHFVPFFAGLALSVSLSPAVGCRRTRGSSSSCASGRAKSARRKPCACRDT